MQKALFHFLTCMMVFVCASTMPVGRFSLYFCCQVVWVFEEDRIEPPGTGTMEGLSGCLRRVLRLQQLYPTDAIGCIGWCSTLL